MRFGKPFTDISTKAMALVKLCHEQKTRADQERGVEEIADAFSELEGVDTMFQMISATVRMS